MQQNKLIQAASSSKLILPFVGVLALGFMIFNVGLMVAHPLSEMISHTPSEHLSLITEGGMVALFVIIRTLLGERRSIGSLGLWRKNSINHLAQGIGIGAGLFGIIVGILHVLGYVNISLTDMSFGRIVAVLVMLGCWLVQAAGEEILTRGRAMPTIASKTNMRIGVLLSSLLFVAIHYGNTGANTIAYSNLFIFGVVFALIALNYKNIWAAIGFHAAWNRVQACVFGMAVSGTPASTIRILTSLTPLDPVLITGGRFGVEASIVTTAVGLILCIVLGWKLIRKA